MQLPYNIWKLIVSYLSVQRAKELYAVNSTLFNIAMDLRYEEALLSTGGPKALVHKRLRVFRYPHLSHRPKILHLDLSSIAVSLARTNKKGFKISLGQIVPLVVNLATRNKLNSVSEIIAFFRDALPQLTAVTEIYMKHDYSAACYDHPLILQSLRDIWQVFGDRLQSLRVHVVFENLKLLLPTPLHLPCLKSLTVHTEGLNSISASACESIISMTVKSYASSLRSVSFTTENAAVDPRPIFRSLQLLPCLQAIHLSFPFGPSIPSPFPVYDLLSSCRGFLEFLSLDFGTYMGGHVPRALSLFHENWCFVGLPHLSELRIDPPIMTLRQEFIDYIHRFAPSLISLWIKPHLILEVHETYKLSSIFHDFSFLRNLSLCILLFCPDILALLARTLPCLQTLTLGYSLATPTIAGLRFYKESPRQFYQAMQPHLHIFRKWQLVSLDYFDLSGPFKPPIERALADHLPNVEWYCGVERSTYISQAQELPGL